LRIQLTGVNYQSHTGPNGAGLRLALELKKQGHIISSENSEIELVFIEKDSHIKNIPIVQRLDGIFYDIKSNYFLQNEKIKQTYGLADAVIIQSEFDKKLINSFFWEHKKQFIIHNGEDLEEIEKISPIQNSLIDKFENVWATASDWRPRKRLKENVRYFLEHSNEKDCLIIAGANPDYEIDHDRIFYVGHLPRYNLLSLFKRSKYFLALFYHEHCSNVIIQARACGCHIICPSIGGTIEICGTSATIIEDIPYDFTPIDLNSPPDLDFEREMVVMEKTDNSDIDIKNMARSYIEILEKVLSEKI